MLDLSPYYSNNEPNIVEFDILAIVIRAEILNIVYLTYMNIIRGSDFSINIITSMILIFFIILILSLIIVIFIYIFRIIISSKAMIVF